MQGSSEIAAHAEVLDMLISLLENAAGDLALLVAASVYRFVICTPCLGRKEWLSATALHAFCALRQSLLPNTANSSNTRDCDPRLLHAQGHCSSNLYIGADCKHLQLVNPAATNL